MLNSSLEAWEPKNTTLCCHLHDARKLHVSQIIEYLTMYSRCKIIRRFFLDAYDSQRRLIGSLGCFAAIYATRARFRDFRTFLRVIARKTRFFAAQRGQRQCAKKWAEFQNEHARVVPPVLNSRVSECPWARTRWNVVRREAGVDSFDGRSRSRLVTDWYLPRCSPTRIYYVRRSYPSFREWIECGVTDR